MADIYQYDKKKDKQTMIKTDTGKRKKEQFIENLREGDVVNDFFSVKIKNPPRPYKKGVWFDFVAMDKTGEIMVKFWGGDNKDRVKRLYDSFSIGDVVQVRAGYVEIYEEKLQLSINETTGGLRRCSPNEYEVSDFIPALEEATIEELYAKLQREIKSIHHEQLHALLILFFNDAKFVDLYKHAPSAITHHHNYVGGNLEHAIGVIELCKTMCGLYEGINRDLLLCGAILHDVGKLLEYKYTAAINKTDIGNFIGHIVLGDRWIREKINELRKNGQEFSENLELHLSHLILSHHGRYEYESPRMPQTVEACALHQADLMDSQVKNFLQRVDEARKQSDEEWGFLYDPDYGKKRAMFLGELEER
jgi:3'-5' exoribonuclease